MAIPTKESVKAFYEAQFNNYKRHYADYTAKSMASIATQTEFGITLSQLSDYLRG